MVKDWTGNMKSTFATLGASSHSAGVREQHDYYATDPKCVADIVDYLSEGMCEIWEPACGEDHIASVLRDLGFKVRSSDLIDRGVGAEVADFLLQPKVVSWDGDIVTNPPYKFAQEFVERSLQVVPAGRRVCMFLKITFLEGQKRRELFATNPPRWVLVYSQRQKCAINGDFASTGSSATCYAWFVWEKGFSGEPTLRWI